MDTAVRRIEPDHRSNYGASLGNLLLLSMLINSSLQNDSFESKKTAKTDASGKKIPTVTQMVHIRESKFPKSLPGGRIKSGIVAGICFGLWNQGGISNSKATRNESNSSS